MIIIISEFNILGPIEFIVNIFHGLLNILKSMITRVSNIGDLYVYRHPDVEGTQPEGCLKKSVNSGSENLVIL